MEISIVNMISQSCQKVSITYPGFSSKPLWYKST